MLNQSIADDVATAYQATGLVPVRGVSIAMQSNGTYCGCALTALIIADGISAEDVHDDVDNHCGFEWDDWAADAIGGAAWEVSAFAAGYDGNRVGQHLSDNLSAYSDEQRAEIGAAYRLGAATWEAVKHLA